MKIEIEFEVFKALTALRKTEADSHNSVLRRLLSLPKAGGIRLNDIDEMEFGVWFGKVYFPHGTKFRATYKGQTYLAEIRDDRWIGTDGIQRSSPSDAASAVSGTNVNGWRFWFAKLPGDPNWRRLDEMR